MRVWPCCPTTHRSAEPFWKSSRRWPTSCPSGFPSCATSGGSAAKSCARKGSCPIWGRRRGFAEGKNDLFTHPLLSEIGTAHDKSVAQVVLRWLIQRGIVTIPKSVNPDRMAQNIDVFDFELTDDQMTQIAALDTGTTLFFDHHDPEMVAWLSKRRLDS